MKLVVGLLALAGCHHAKPEAHVYGGTNGRVVVGSKVQLSASWNATCTDWGASIGNALDSKDHDGEDATKACHEKPFELSLSCSSKCEKSLIGQSVGRTNLYVIPLEVGPLTIATTSKRTDNGASKDFSFQIAVTLPDKLELHCANREGGGNSLCGPDGVPASEPTIVPVIVLDKDYPQSTLLRINGRPHPHADTGKISLAELYPDAADGTRIKPGTYEVTLELAGMISKWQVEAR